MCPAHRQQVLERVRLLLAEGRTCRLISTQCVEAGVDLDFPVVYRSMGPLDAIAQVAGRCNRNGLARAGLVYIFRPEEDGYPDRAYKQATDVASAILAGADSTELETAGPELFQRYYRELYSVRGIEHLGPEDDELLGAIKRQDFAQVCQYYRVIKQDTINVLVPYEREVFSRLKEEVNSRGLSREWIIKARPYTVSLFRPRSPQDELYLCLEPIPVRPGRLEETSDWYIYRKEEDYDLETGLNPSLSPQAIIA